MLNDTARSLTSERVIDQRTAAGGPLSLNCATCGGRVELATWQPQARCPYCNTLGFPDRALRNLLPLGWNCPACGAANDGRTNFCLKCGTGLASRCHRCEAPVYSSVCMQCGEHQARPRQLQKSQSERIEWLPVQRERIEKQVAHLRSLETAEAVPEPVLPPRSAQDNSRAQTRKEARQQAKAERKARSKGDGFPGWLFFVMIGGALLVARESGAKLQLTAAESAATAPSAAWTSFQGWLSGLSPSLAGISTLTPDDPRYAYLFLIVLVGIIALPFGLYLVDRVIKRLFP